MPRSLDLNKLKQFEPNFSSGPVPKTHATIDLEPERWPSREPSIDGQISIKGPMTTIDRFKKLCKDDRRTYADMLDILMKHFDQS